MEGNVINEAEFEGLLHRQLDKADKWELAKSQILRGKDEYCKSARDFIEIIAQEPIEGASAELSAVYKIVLHDRPVKPALEKAVISTKDLKPSMVFTRSLYCSFCSKLVSQNFSTISMKIRFECAACPAIAHRECVIKHMNCSPNDKESWHCQDCTAEVAHTNAYYGDKYHSELYMYERDQAATKIQTYYRMRYLKKKYYYLKKGVKRFQRAIRRIQARRKKEILKLKLLRPIRIRLHSIKGIFCTKFPDPVEAEEGEERESEYFPIHWPNFGVIGCIKSSMYESLFNPFSSYNHSSNSTTKDLSAEMPLHADEDMEDGSISNDTPKTSRNPVSTPRAVKLTPRTKPTPVAKQQQHRSSIASLRQGSQISQIEKLPPLSPAKKTFQQRKFFDDENSSVDSNNNNNRVEDVNNSHVVLPSQLSVTLVDILRHGNIYQPTYAQPTRNIQAFPTGQVMLTVTLLENRDITSHSTHPSHSNSDDTNENTNVNNSKLHQLYRIDIPLKMVPRASNERISIELLEALGADLSVLTSETLADLMQNYIIVDYIPTKTYLLFPAAPAHVVVRMVMSQIIKWPNSLCIGKLQMKLNEYLIWKQTVVFQQGLHDCLWSDIPAGDELNRMVLYNRNHAKTKNRNRISHILSSSATPKVQSPTRQNFSDISMNYDLSNGVIVWSIISFNDEGENFGGYIEFRAQYETSPFFRKIWCVIQDRSFMLFTNPTFIYPEVAIDLRTAIVSPEEQGIIKVKGTFNESYFVRTTASSDMMKFFKRLYGQSQSAVTKPFFSVLNSMLASSRSKQADYSVFLDGWLKSIMDITIVDEGIIHENVALTSHTKNWVEENKDMLRKHAFLKRKEKETELEKRESSKRDSELKLPLIRGSKRFD